MIFKNNKVLIMLLLFVPTAVRADDHKTYESSIRFCRALFDGRIEPKMNLFWLNHLNQKRLSKGNIEKLGAKELRQRAQRLNTEMQVLEDRLRELAVVWSAYCR